MILLTVILSYRLTLKASNLSSNSFATYLIFYMRHKRKVRYFGEETNLILALHEVEFLHTCLSLTNPLVSIINIAQSSDPAAAAAAALPPARPM